MTQLKVFTLNVWGIPYISKDRLLRMNAIAEAMSSKDYDVVCLQEIWDTTDYELIYSKIKSKMPYKYYFYSGLLGSGLCTFSKWPILETFYYKFPLNGYVHKIHHGDWFAGKGVGLVKLKVNDKIIHVFNTHLHAQYCEENDEYLSHRLSQAYDASQLVNLGSENSALTLFVGDFNSKPSDICCKVLRFLPDLQDAFINVETEHEYGTNETSRNSYTPPEVLKKNPLGGRLDYILFKSNSHHEARSLMYDFAFPERIPSSDVSYSDHEAIEATIELKEKSSHTPDQSNDPTTFRDVLRQSYDICENGLRVVANKMRKLKIYFLILMACIGVSVLVQVDKDHHFSSFTWFLLYFPQFVFLAIIGLYYVLHQIEFQSLCGFQNNLAVQETFQTRNKLCKGHRPFHRDNVFIDQPMVIKY